MTSTSRTARIAGLLYLAGAVVGFFNVMYVPNALIVRSDPIATAHNIATHDVLFRLGIVSDLLVAVLGIAITLALYRLFKDVDKNLAVLMVILGGIIQTPIFFFNALNWVAVLLLVHGSHFTVGAIDYLAVFVRPEREALAMLFISLHHYGWVVSEIFSGLWLFPFGMLVFRSGFLPRLLGVWLIVNGVGYLAISFSEFLLPRYANTISTFAFPALFGEIAIILWLLIMGAKERSVTALGV
jgi:hypothetical protein